MRKPRTETTASVTFSLFIKQKHPHVYPIQLKLVLLDWFLTIEREETKYPRPSLRPVQVHFHPCCNARLDPISCNTKFPDYLKPSKIVFLKSHPGHMFNCFTVITFDVRHFIVSLQYFEFFPVESYSVNRVGEKDNVRIFSLSRST